MTLFDRSAATVRLWGPSWIGSLPDDHPANRIASAGRELQLKIWGLHQDCADAIGGLRTGRDPVGRDLTPEALARRIAAIGSEALGELQRLADGPVGATWDAYYKVLAQLLAETNAGSGGVDLADGLVIARLQSMTELERQRLLTNAAGTGDAVTIRALQRAPAVLDLASPATLAALRMTCGRARRADLVVVEDAARDAAWRCQKLLVEAANSIADLAGIPAPEWPADPRLLAEPALVATVDKRAAARASASST